MMLEVINKTRLNLQGERGRERKREREREIERDKTVPRQRAQINQMYHRVVHRCWHY